MKNIVYSLAGAAVCLGVIKGIEALTPKPLGCINVWRPDRPLNPEEMDNITMAIANSAGAILYTEEPEFSKADEIKAVKEVERILAMVGAEKD